MFSSQTHFIFNVRDNDDAPQCEEPFESEKSRHRRCGCDMKVSTLHSKFVKITFIESKHGVKGKNERFLFVFFM